jgi:hypothetical protein
LSNPGTVRDPRVYGQVVAYTIALVAILLVGFRGGSTASGEVKPGSDRDASGKRTAPRSMTIAWGGDVTLGSSYGQPPAQGWGLLAPVARTLRSADVAAVNYEGVLGSGGASKCGAAPGANCFAFQAPPANARSLRRAGVDIVNQANNHAFDFGAAGLTASRAALRAARVGVTGGPDEIVTVRNVAFVGFSTYPWSAPMGNDAAVSGLVRRAATQADVVVAFFHAGAEGADKTHVPRGPESAFGEFRGDSRHFARVAIDAGADLVLGSGPHVLRGLELYRGRLIAYSLGNLAGYHNFSTSGLSGLSALLTARVDDRGRFLGGKIDALRLDSAAIPSRGGDAVRLMRDLTKTDFAGGGLRFSPTGKLQPKGARPL